MGHHVPLVYPDAPSGTWSIVTHADPTLPGVAYSDFDCTQVKTARALNASGRDKFYVDAAVDVTVYNSSGVAVDSFTAGVDGALVNVTAPSLTGTLANGTQGLGGRLSLEEVIARLRASFGADDGYVKETGQSTTLLLKDALQSVRTLNSPVYNVKSAPYNAAGNGSTNDTTAIQAAITAAAAAGGGVVYIPRGTYITSSSLTVSNTNVTIRGDGASSIVQFTGGSGNHAFTFTGSGAQAGNSISDLNIYASSSGSLITVSNNPGFRVQNCTLRTASTGAGVVTTNNMLFVTGNYFDVPLTSATGRGIVEYTSGTNSALVVVGNIASTALVAPDACLCAAPSTATAPSILAVGNVLLGANAYVIGLNTTNGLGTYVAIGNVGNPIYVFPVAVTAGVYVEAGNSGAIFFSGTTTTTTVYSLTAAVSTVDRGTSGASFSPTSGIAEEIIDVTGTPIAVNAPTNASWNGQVLRMRIRNTTAGAVTFNWNAAYLGSSAMGNLAAGATRVVNWVRRNSGAATGWRYAGHWDTT